MNFETIILEKKEGVAKITLNRPQVLNALNELMLRELRDALEDVQADESVQVVVITGAGRAFSAGRDMKEFRDRRTPEGGEVGPGGWLYQAFEMVEKPVIAAVNGYCYTGALELALCCDMIIASENAVFADTHARYGLVHGGGGSQRLPRLLGAMKAKELLFTCEPVTAVEAERIGLVNRVVPADKLEAAVDDLVGKILKNSQSSVQTIKFLVNRGMRLGLAAGLELEQTHWRGLRRRAAAEEQVERLSTFLERGKA